MKRLSHRLRRPLIHRNQRRLSAHIPRLHPLLPRAARLVRAVATVFEPLVLASSEVVGYRPFSYRGRTIYYRVDNLNLLSDSSADRAPGLLLYFDGDHISRAGSRLLRRHSPLRAELARVAEDFNMLSVPILAPGSLSDGTGLFSSLLTINWWVRARSHGRTVRALIKELSLAYGLDMSRVWFAGYSGGAEFLSYELLTRELGEVTGAGASLIAGGGVDGIPAKVRQRALENPTSHRGFLMSWHVGLRDGRSPSGMRLRARRLARRKAPRGGSVWSAQVAAQEGIAFYEGARRARLCRSFRGAGTRAILFPRWWPRTSPRRSVWGISERDLYLPLVRVVRVSGLFEGFCRIPCVKFA